MNFLQGEILPTSTTFLKRKQECIPVGCVPPDLYRTGGGLCPGDVSVQGGLCPGGLCQENPPGQRPLPPVNRMTSASKNITLPQTSFAGGKNRHIPEKYVTSVQKMKTWKLKPTVKSTLSYRIWCLFQLISIDYYFFDIHQVFPFFNVAGI